MARKTKSRTRSTTGSSAGPGDSAQAIRDSAQKIWLAGLGAFERAKTEGPRMFETLVEQGRTLGARAASAADEAMRTVREANQPGGKWDKLEQVFEDRVSKSLSRLGVITGREIDELSRQVQELNESVRNMMADGAPAKKRATRPSSPGRKAKPGTRKKKAATRASRARQA